MKINTCLALATVVLFACEGSRPPSPDPATTPKTEPAATAPSPQARSGQGTRPTPLSEWDASFDGETRDAAWASRMEADLATGAARLKGSKLQKVECRTTVCRLDFVFDGPLPMQTFDSDLNGVFREAKLMSGTSGSYGHGVRSDEDAHTATVFVTKPGYMPPEADGTPRPVPPRP